MSGSLVRDIRTSRHGWRLKNPSRLGLLLAGVALVTLSVLGVGPMAGREEALAGGAAGRQAVYQDGPSSKVAGTVIVEVIAQPGDTLWTLASKLYPKEDPRSGVARLRRLNSLTSGAIQAGQTLKAQLPAQVALSLGLIEAQPSTLASATASGR